MRSTWLRLPLIFRFRRTRRGLTLVELVVVMTVLAALAAIVIPMFPNLLRRAHKVSDATNSSEMAKAMLTHQAMFVSYPDNFDLLTDGSSATFPSFLPGAGSSAGAFGGFATPQALTQSEIDALGRVGVRFVQKLSANTSPAGFHPTMNPYAGDYKTAQVDLSASGATSVKFAVIDMKAAQTANPSFLQTITANDPTAKFVVFGIGPRCTMVGQTIHDAPTSVPQDKDFTPDNTYSRVGVIFMVSGVEVSRTERARFIAACALEDDELEMTEKDLVGYYQVLRDPNN
jgi:prepilin-type N-terminal cleavage/methylation domain-containing protein